MVGASPSEDGMVVKMASDEAARLRVELEAIDKKRDSILSRLDRLETYLAIHAEFSGSPASQLLDPSPNHEKVSAQSPARIVSVPRAPGSGERIMRAVVDILRDAGRPIMTRDLLAPLGVIGIRLGGGDATRATSHLSSVLSKHRSILRGSRRTGWSLVEWDETKGLTVADPLVSAGGLSRLQEERGEGRSDSAADDDTDAAA